MILYYIIGAEGGGPPRARVSGQLLKELFGELLREVLGALPTRVKNRLKRTYY